MSIKCKVALAGLMLLAAGVQAEVQAEVPAELLQEFDGYPHAQRVSLTTESVIDHEVGLGAIRKVRGAWGFKESERLSGELTRYTWQVGDGFTAGEVLAELESRLPSERLLFSCDGRSCGKGAQWANRVFNERLLYGRDDEQRYRVYGEDAGTQAYRLLLFSSARTADRQYLHAELLKVRP